MKKIIPYSLLSLFLLGTSFGVSGQAIFTAKGTGNWANTNTWTLTSGTDADGLPDINDVVFIGETYYVTVNSTQYCDSLIVSVPNGTKKSCGITVTTTGQLHVTRSIYLNRDASGRTTFEILGIVSTGNNFYLTSSKTGGCGANPSKDSSNTVILGAKNSSAQLLIGKNLEFSQAACSDHPMNLINFIQGTIDINGDIQMIAPAGIINTNQIIINDDTYDGLPKTIYLGGRFLSTNGMINFDDTNNNSTFTLYLDGTGAQNIPAIDDRFIYRHIDIRNASGEVSLGGALTNTTLKGYLYLRSYGTLNNKGYDITVNAYPSQLKVYSNARFINEGADVFPGQYVGATPVTSLDDSSFVEFYCDSAITVLNDNFTFPNLEFSGTGKKTLAGSLDGINKIAGSIRISGGTLSTPLTNNAQYTLTSGINGFADINRKTMVHDGATLEFQNNLLNVPASRFEFDYNSTLQYSYTGTDQVIYSLFADYPVDTTIAQLGNLTLSGASTKHLTEKTLEVRRKVSLLEGALNLEQSSNIILLSDASNTAWVGEIASAFQGINYSGNPEGKFTVQRYIYLPNSKYRDYSSPIQNCSLKDFQLAGMKFQGFPGSGRSETTPSACNAFTYDESHLGMENIGFYKATSIHNAIDSTVNNKFNRRGWRIFTGSSLGLTLNLANAGRLYTGNVDFVATFTRSNESRMLDDGWNFVGNPYACTLDWDKIQADNGFGGDTSQATRTSGIMPTVYIWKPYDNGNPAGALAYGSYNAITKVGINLPDGLIPSYQGFWVKVYEDTLMSSTRSFTIKESHKSDTQKSFYKSESADILAKISISGESSFDMIGLHYWNSATVGLDRALDILKPQAPSNDSLWISFTDRDELLPVVVNAIPKEQMNYSFPLVINTPVGQTYTLAFSNLQQLINGFDCAMLTDELTGTTTDLKTVSSYSFESAASYQGKRFTISLSRTIKEALALENASCNAQPGKMKMNVKNYGKNVDLTLFSEGQTIASFRTGKISEPLFAGNYELVDNSPLPGCKSAPVMFTIEEPQPVVAAFSVKNEAVPAGSEVNFENSSSGAVNYQWEFSDDLTTSTAAEPSHTFSQPGVYTVTLRAENENSECYSITRRNIVVTEALNSGQIVLGKNFTVLNGEENIAVNNLSGQTCTALLYGIDGKLIDQHEFAASSHNFSIERKNQVLMVIIRQGENSYQQKLVH